MRNTIHLDFHGLPLVLEVEASRAEGYWDVERVWYNGTEIEPSAALWDAIHAALEEWRASA